MTAQEKVAVPSRWLCACYLTPAAGDLHGRGPQAVLLLQECRGPTVKGAVAAQVC